MAQIKTERILIGIPIAWPLLCLLVFNKWFFLSPLGLLIAFGIPIAVWAFWLKFYRAEGQRIAFNDKFSVGKGVGFLADMKKRLIN
jgi:hypothetical protein